VRFRRTFGLAGTVEWNNLCRSFDLHPFKQGSDSVVGTGELREILYQVHLLPAVLGSRSHALFRGVEDSSTTKNQDFSLADAKGAPASGGRGGGATGEEACPSDGN
jgi:hypothetical protein